MSGAKISGRKFNVENKDRWEFDARPGGWVIARRVRADGTRERVRFAYAERRMQWWASIGGRSLYGEWIPETRGGASAESGDADLTAQFPGKVRKVLVQAGQSVKEGDALLLVEAMKMEFAIKAPHDGKIETVHVSDGQQISPGDRFVDLIKLGPESGSAADEAASDGRARKS